MIQKLQDLFKRIVDKIEINELPVKRYLFLFLAILSVRLCLEFFSNQRLFKAEDTIHIGLWFIFIVEAFMIQLHLFSKEDVRKIIKLVVCCFSIALTAPLIDMIVSQGKFVKMNYLSVNSLSDIGWSYITIGGASLTRGATLGIRIEIVLLVFASFNYVYVKTGSILRSLLGTWCIYTILFLSGTIPFMMQQLNALFGITYGQNDMSSIYLLFTLDIAFFMFLVFRLKRQSLPYSFSWIGLIRLISSIGLVVFGACLAKFNYPDNWILDPTTIYYFPLLAIIIFLFFTFDNISLRKLKVPTQQSSFGFQNGIFALILGTSACVSFNTCFAAMLIWGTHFILLESPLRFVKVPLLSSLFRSMSMVGYLLMGFMSFGAPMIGIPTKTVLLLLICSFSVFLSYEFYKMRQIKNIT